MCFDQAKRKRWLPSFPSETSLTPTSSDHKRSFGCSRIKNFTMKYWPYCAREGSSTGLSGTSHFCILIFPPSENSPALFRPRLWTLLLLNTSLITQAGHISLLMRASPPSETWSSRKVTSGSWWDQLLASSYNPLKWPIATTSFSKIVWDKLTKSWKISPLNSAKPSRFSTTTWPAS